MKEPCACAMTLGRGLFLDEFLWMVKERYPTARALVVPVEGFAAYDFLFLDEVKAP